MPSIIDSITNAETEAAAIKRDAAAKAREAIVNAGNEVQQQLALERDQGRERLHEAQLRAEKQGEEIAREILKEKSAQADQLCAQARSHIDEAVSYILGKVKQA